MKSELFTKLWIISQIAKFILDGGGTFRKLIYEYLELDYASAYGAGGMTISNCVNDARYKLADKVELLEKWRDWHWRQYLYHKHITGSIKEESVYYVSSHIYNDVLSIIGENTPVLESECHAFDDLSYGEYPDAEKLGK